MKNVFCENFEQIYNTKSMFLQIFLFKFKLQYQPFLNGGANDLQKSFEDIYIL